MKRLAIVFVVLLMVSSISFALELGGSTQVAAIGNGDEQRMEIDQEVDIDVGAFHIDVNGGFDYNFWDKAKFWDYDIGGKYTLGILTVGASFTGNQDLNVNEIKAFADIVVGPVGADVDVLFSADETIDAFRGLDVSAFYNPGPFSFRVGYLFTENGAPDINAPELLTNGGVYAKAKVTY